MKSKTAKNGLYGMLAVTGFFIICCCDTETAWQLFLVICLGFGLMCLGGRGLIKNGQDRG